MLMPPVATGFVDRDDESVGRSTSAGKKVLSEGSAGTEARNAAASANGASDFKNAYLKVSARNKMCDRCVPATKSKMESY